jgi:hypothetical protein
VDTAPPTTTIDGGPLESMLGSTASFTYHANRPDTVFECSMDAAPFSSCPTGRATYSELALGPHTFRVRAIDFDNEVEASPPAFTFEVVTPPPPLTCRKGFRKKTVRGVARCVKKKKHRHRRHHRHS